MRAAAVLLAAVFAALALAAGGMLDGAEDATLDARFAVRGTQPVEGVAVVAIDERTFATLDTTWPMPRGQHARMLDQLRRAGARQVVYDVQFTEPSGRPGQDLALFDAVERFPGTILATGESDARGRTRVLGGDDNLRRIGARAAAANLPSSPTGVIRRYERVVGRLDTIATATAERFATAPADSDALIDFRGPPGTIPTYSFADVYTGQVGADELRGQIVVVGATAATLQDLHQVSAPGREMSGPEIQASAILTALHGNPLHEPPAWVAYALALCFALAGAGAVLRLGVGAGLGVVALLAAVSAAGAQAAFGAGLVLPVAVPLAALLTAAVIATAAALARAGAERRRVDWLNRELEAAVEERTEALERTQLEVVERLARTAELRDDETGEHVDRMSRLCERLALQLGWPAERAAQLGRAAVLHDIGKVGLVDAILRKPGRLTDDERAEMQRHAAEGGAILAGSHSPLLQTAEVIARTHHERFDGTGYPARLAGADIPVEGRIAAVADVYDALTSERPYKRAWTHAEALDEVVRGAGSQFDPEVVAALRTVLADRPPDFVATLGSDAGVDAARAAGAGPLGAARLAQQPGGADVAAEVGGVDALAP